MGLDIALQNAISGLRATQAQIQVISGNIANAQTPGYSRQVLPQLSVETGTGGAGVTTGVITRVTDQALDANLLKQATTASAASTRDAYFQQMQALLGQVNSGNTLNDSLDNFTAAMQTLATTPEDAVAQNNAIAAGQQLTEKLNGLSSGVQTLRQQTDADLASAVTTLNTALNSIASLNAQISRMQGAGESTASLEDQRDQALNQVAQLVAVNSVITSDGSMVVMTTTGQTLVSSSAQQVGYTQTGAVTAAATLSPLTINGIDVTNDFNTGKIGALLQLRDTDLPGLTAQLNQFANNLFNGTQVSQSSETLNMSGTPAGGDTLTVTIDGTSVTTNALPANPTLADIASAINAKLGATTFSASVSGNGIKITDSAGNPITASIAVATGTGTETFTPGLKTNALGTSNSGLGATSDANHFFADVNVATGVDNAGSIEVNPSLVANPALLLTGNGTADPTISQALSAALAGNFTFAAAGDFTTSTTTTLDNYAAQVMGQNASSAAAASSDASFQSQLQTQLQTQASSASGVNLDEELGNLVVYQNAYSASARVVTTVQAMFAALMSM